ncbi:MAG TPA: hypothetical protein ENN12_05230 [Epsilonproteobacteria bacterium]|nr:hypothetical protein [Campylobacterota bacterium]
MGAKSQKNDFFLGLSLRVVAIIVISILFFGWYIGGLLFGENSLLALKKLQNEKCELNRQVKSLQVQNAKLQKDFFELKQLEPASQTSQ